MTLSHKINSLIAFVAISLGSLGAYIGGETTATALRTELSNQGEFIASAVADTYVEAVTQNDLLPIFEGINKIVNENDNISYIYITGFSGEPIAHTFGNGFPVELLKVWDRLPAQSNLTRIRDSNGDENFIEIRNSLIEGLPGHTHVGLSLRPTDQKVNEYYQIVMTITLGATGLFLLFGFFISKQLTKPIKAITDLTYRYAHGESISEQDFALSGKGGKEIEQLSSAYQVMLNERKASEQKISHMAYHDHLTGLPNQLLLRDRIDQLLLMSHRSEVHFAVLFMDIDNFKSINDSLGHSIGDELLKMAAELLRSTLRDVDTIARIGGDEFVIVLKQIESLNQAESVANKILQQFKDPISVKSYELSVSWSIGLSIYPNDGADGESLMKAADAAMYSAKRKGKNNYQFYSSILTAASAERFLIENQLKKAVSAKQFVLYYQPQISIDEPQNIQVEALIRWIHPDQGLISPARFIPIAEETRSIVDIGAWVIDEAVRQLAEWIEKGVNVHRVSLNVSYIQLHFGELLDTLNRSTQQYKVPADRIELEITESAILKDSVKAQDVLNRLKEKGYKLSIDDFGTGYSSLSQLKSLPLHKLKIDKSFVDDIPGDPDSETVAKSIVNLAKNLGLEVIAEGVESLEQQDFLANAGCHEFQGYLYSWPVPHDELEKWLENYKAVLSSSYR